MAAPGERAAALAGDANGPVSPPGAFSARGRTINAEDEMALTSVGIDVGSSTSHLVFSRVVMERRGFVYAVRSRELLFESELLLTPYSAPAVIDAAALGRFVAAQYASAGKSADSVETGALILTGVAARRANARAIGEALAAQAGRLVAVSAGDWLETTLVAHGSGAVQQSARDALRIMNVDVGGGTSKIALCAHGEIVDRTVIDVGARLVSFDAAGRVATLEDAGACFAAAAGIDVRIGRPLAPEARSRLAEAMADVLFEAMGAAPMREETRPLLRLPPLGWREPPQRVVFSGGVAEYLYGREQREYGDLGPLLASAIRRRADAWGIAVDVPPQGIRATVIGASQYTVQLSGNTIFVAPTAALPVRNVSVMRPPLPLASEALDATAIGAALAAALRQHDPERTLPALALGYGWQGSASYARLDAFCRGVRAGLAPLLERGVPVVLVTEADVGGLVGLHWHELGPADAVISIDGITLGELDFIDIGALIEASGAVPVVIKSLLFPTTSPA